MPLQAKHIVDEIDGVRCTIVEKGATAQRVEFLKNLLTFNNFEVLTSEDKSAPDSNRDETATSTFTIGVTDLIFNPVIAVYQMKLKTPEGGSVSPAYWDQITDRAIDQYWLTEDELKTGDTAWYLKPDGS